jgi:hypothetical protein
MQAIEKMVATNVSMPRRAFLPVLFIELATSSVWGLFRN